MNGAPKNVVPPYITAAEVGRACGKSTVWAKRLLQRVGIAEKIGGEWNVGDSRLRHRLPEVYERVFEYFTATAAEDRRKQQTIADDRATPDS